ncbi:MAG: 3'(2'),5'-bisphosphate nucleotidase [Cyanobacteria bacterium P01_H01_bin.15]
MSEDYSQELAIIRPAAIDAGRLCEKIRQHPAFLALSKSDQSPVTLADLASQVILCRAIKSAFPSDPIVGEEDASLLAANLPLLEQVTEFVQTVHPDSQPSDILHWLDEGCGEVADRYWTLDPIDGTKGFIRGDQYAVAIALIEQGAVKFGLMACPALPQNPQQPDSPKGVIFWASAGSGAWLCDLNTLTPQRLTVRQLTDVRAARLIESIETTHSDRAEHRAVANALGIELPPIQRDSLAKYGAIALGEADLYLRIPLPQYLGNYFENIWDHAAGAIVVEESGGLITDLDGKPLDFSEGPKLLNNCGIIASGSSIHSEVLSVIQLLQLGSVR